MLLGALTVATAAAGCGSGSGSNDGASTASTACPFSGATTPTSGPAAGAASATATGVTTRSEGCIDNVQFDFAPGVPAWSIAYSSSVPADLQPNGSVPAGAQLVVRFPGVAATATPTSPGGTVPTKGLGQITQVTEARAADGSLAWILTVGTQRPFVASASGVPAYLVVGVG